MLEHSPGHRSLQSFSREIGRDFFATQALGNELSFVLSGSLFKIVYMGHQAV
jgi:hypothetical protein